MVCGCDAPQTPDIFERLFELWPQAVVWEGVEELLLSCTSLQQPGVEPFHMLLDTIETLPRTDELTWNHFPRMLLIVFHFCEVWTCPWAHNPDRFSSAVIMGA